MKSSFFHLLASINSFAFGVTTMLATFFSNINIKIIAFIGSLSWLASGIYFLFTFVKSIKRKMK
jgi:hypothetical protein